MLFKTFLGDGTAAYTQCTAAYTRGTAAYTCGTAAYTCGTAAYIVNCDFNENPKSDFDSDLGFVKTKLKSKVS